MEIILLTIIGIISRLTPHLPNMTPVGSIVLFTGAKFGMKKGMIILLLTMLFTDVLLGLHPVMWATYGSFTITLVIGKWLQKNCTYTRIITGVLISSLVFFVISNFAVWLVPNSMYAKTLTGLIQCYIMAIPFFRNSLIGDVSYSTIFFGIYALVMMRYHSSKIPHP